MRRTRTPCDPPPNWHHATNTAPLASVTMSGRVFVPPEPIVTVPPGERPRCTMMSPTLYHVSIGVPSAVRVTPGVRPYAASASSTRDVPLHDPDPLAAVAVSSPCVGITAPKNTRTPPGSAIRVGSAPRLQPETIVDVLPSCPAGEMESAWMDASPAVQATFS